MKFYYYGTIYKSKNDKIVLDVYGTGYLINVINTNNFIDKEKQKIYVYETKTGEMYGFKKYYNYLIFKALLNVKGLVHYRAINILKQTNAFDLCKSIVDENLEKFKLWSLPTSLALKVITNLKKTAIFIIDNYINKNSELNEVQNESLKNYNIDFNQPPFNYEE